MFFSYIADLKHVEQLLNNIASGSQTILFLKNEDGTTIKINPGCKLMLLQGLWNAE